MRILHCYALLTAGLGMVIFVGANGAEASVGGGTRVAYAETSPVVPSTPTNPVPPVTSLQGEPDRLWTQVRDYTFEQRTEFINALQRLEVQLDESIAGLKAKRATFPGDLVVWDREMKRLDAFHTDLKAKAAEITDATATNWEDRKQRFSVAWERMKAAYERATSLTPP